MPMNSFQRFTDVGIKMQYGYLPELHDRLLTSLLYELSASVAIFFRQAERKEISSSGTKTTTVVVQFLERYESVACHDLHYWMNRGWSEIVPPGCTRLDNGNYFISSPEGMN